jgi:hypothetical protein
MKATPDNAALLIVGDIDQLDLLRGQQRVDLVVGISARASA